MKKTKILFKDGLKSSLNKREYFKYLHVIIILFISYIIFVTLCYKLNWLSITGSSHNDFVNNIYYQFIATVFLGPILEEIIFRKFVLSKLLKNIKFANCIQAVLFSMIHWIPVLSIHAFLLGIVFGNCYRKSENILYPIGLHIIWNLFGVVWANFLSYKIMLGSINNIFLIILFIGLVINIIYIALKNKSLEIFKL